MASNSLDTCVMDLRARTAKLEKGLDGANQKIRKKLRTSGKTMAKDMSLAFAKIGSAAIASIGIVNRRKEAVNLGSEITDMATATRAGSRCRHVRGCRAGHGQTV